MADTSWTERRRRMVKCKIHGLHYDPQMSTGCTRCLREAAKAQPQRSPQLVLILLCLLGMAGILFYIFGPGGGESAPIIDLGVASASGTAAQKLDPEPFRAQVEALETALFRTPIDETGDLLVVSADVAAAAAELSSRILEEEPVHGLTAADLIARLGQAMPTDQVALADVQRARTQWLSVRKQQLHAADWFLSPPASGTATASDPVADYSDVAASLRAALEDGAAQARATLSAEGGTLPAGDGWRSFARDWSSQLDSLRSRLPRRPPADADARLLTAVQDLEQAMAQGRALAAETSTPDPSRFDAAVTLALRAQQGFDDLR